MKDLSYILVDATTWGVEARRINANLEVIKAAIEATPVIKLATITSINGIYPDASGDITITAQDVKAIPASSYGASNGTPQLDQFSIIKKAYLPSNLRGTGQLFLGVATLQTEPEENGFYVAMTQGQYVNFYSSSSSLLTVTKDDLATNTVLFIKNGTYWKKILVYLPIPEIPTWSTLEGIPKFADIAYTGSYKDLVDLPEFSALSFSGSFNDLADVPEFASVAYTGSFLDVS